jgi:hypothetical protein
MKRKPMFLTNPFIPAKEPIGEFVSTLRPEEKRRLLDGEWKFDDEEDNPLVIYGGSRGGGRAFLEVKAIKNAVKPPYRYEYVQGKYLVIIGKGEGRVFMPLATDRFPQKIVDMLEDPNI